MDEWMDGWMDGWMDATGWECHWLWMPLVCIILPRKAREPALPRGEQAAHRERHHWVPGPGEKQQEQERYYERSQISEDEYQEQFHEQYQEKDQEQFQEHFIRRNSRYTYWSRSRTVILQE